VAAQVRAIRGATSLDVDEVDHLTERTVALLEELLERNGVSKDDLISILFTATDDIHCVFPAAAARTMGLGDVPLICARELDIVGGMPMCIRVMVHCTTERARADLHHIYHGATKSLRDDLPA
jgi:chorismate mutase